MPSATSRRFVYYVAASADGFIARKDGSVDWLESATGDYGAQGFMASVDTIVWGRTTFDEAASRGGLAPFGDKMQHIVLTHRPLPPSDRVEVTSDVAALATRLRGEKGKVVWVMGGAVVAAAFLDEGLLDEVVVHVIPTLLGEGIPLFKPGPRNVQLRLRESHAFPDGVVRLHYVVEGR